MKPRPFVASLVLVLGAGCESTNITPVADSGARLEEDERRIWARAAEEEDVLDHSGFLAQVPGADAYLSEVLVRLHPRPLAEGARWRVKVLVDPTLNAFALPDGTIYIHTGMLARLENEAQLAAILGHELTHATHRHGLKGLRNLKNKTAFMAAFNAGTAGVGGLLGAIGAAAAVSGYSQDLEREADATGFRLLLAAGYDPREASKVFHLLLAESKHSKIKEPFFFGSHPRLEERITSYEQLVAALPPGRRTGRTGAEAYAAQIPEILLLNAAAAQRAGDLEFAHYCVERSLRLRPGNAGAALLLAEIQRKRGADDDALRLYRELTEIHPEFAGAYRGLGLLLFKRGDRPAAAAAFQRYLALEPGASDRSYIEAFIKQCETNS